MSISDCSCRISRAVVAVLAALVLTTGSAQAQSGAAVTGTISDRQGFPLPGVTLTLRNAESGLSRDTVTTDAGSYRFAALPRQRSLIRR